MTLAEILARKRPAILVERHLGGLGDLICMREAVRSLSEAHPGFDVYAHVQRWYFPLFEDIATHLLAYQDSDLPIMWPMGVNISAGCAPLFAHQCFCPCGMHEEQTQFRPTRSRVENFADALGVEPRHPDLTPLLRRWGKRRPRPRKRLLIGLQPWSMNPSKDWPVTRWHALAQMFTVLDLARVRIFATENVDWKLAHVECVHARGCRELIESAAECDLMIAPDSGLMHIAGALDIPTVALFGPTDGPLTCRYYPSVRVIEHRAKREKCHQPCYYNVDHNRYHCLDRPEDEYTARIGDCLLEIKTIEVYHAALDLLRAANKLCA